MPSKNNSISVLHNYDMWYHFTLVDRVRLLEKISTLERMSQSSRTQIEMFISQTNHHLEFEFIHPKGV